MNSKQIMKSACRKKGVRQVASIMEIAPTALYNQMNGNMGCQDIVQRFLDFCNATESSAPLEFVSEELNGYFVANPEVSTSKNGSSQKYVSVALQEFSHLIDEIGKAMEDGEISKSEAVRIRKEWEDLKRNLESFVLACEYGFVK